MSEVLQFNGIELPVAEQMKFYDTWGSQYAYNHMAVPWAWAFDTPYKWTKQVPSFFGGTRQGMAISWPALIRTRAASATSSTTSSTSRRQFSKRPVFRHGDG